MRQSSLSILIVVVVFFIYSSEELFSHSDYDLPDSIIYHKKFDEIYLGGGIEMKDISNNYYSIGVIKSYKMTNLVYFTIDNNFMGTFSDSERRYAALSVSPGFTFTHYFGNSFRIFETSTLGISYMFKGKNPGLENIGYCGGAIIGFGYGIICLDVGIKHYEHKGASYTPLTFGLRIDTNGLF